MAVLGRRGPPCLGARADWGTVSKAEERACSLFRPQQDEDKCGSTGVHKIYRWAWTKWFPLLFCLVICAC